MTDADIDMEIARARGDINSFREAYSRDETEKFISLCEMILKACNETHMTIHMGRVKHWGSPNYYTKINTFNTLYRIFTFGKTYGCNDKGDWDIARITMGANDEKDLAETDFGLDLGENDPLQQMIADFGKPASGLFAPEYLRKDKRTKPLGFFALDKVRLQFSMLLRPELLTKELCMPGGSVSIVNKCEKHGVQNCAVTSVEKWRGEDFEFFSCALDYPTFYIPTELREEVRQRNLKARGF